MPAGTQYGSATEILPATSNWFGGIVYDQAGKSAFMLGGRNAAHPLSLTSQGHGPDTRSSVRLAMRGQDGSWTDTLVDDGAGVRQPAGYVLNHGTWPTDMVSGAKGMVIVGYIPFWTNGNLAATSVGLSWFSADGRKWQRTDLRAAVGSADAFRPGAVTTLADGSFIMTGALTSRDTKRASTALILRSTDGRTWRKAGAIKGHWSIEPYNITSLGSTLIMTGVENACDTDAYGLLTFSTGQQFRLWTSTDKGTTWSAQDRTAGGVITSAEPLPTSAKGCPKSSSGNYLQTLQDRFASTGSMMGVINGRAWFSNGQHVSSTADFVSWTTSMIDGLAAVGVVPTATIQPPQANTLVDDGDAVVALSLQFRRNDQDQQIPGGAGSQVLSWRSTDGGATWTRLPMPRPLILHDSQSLAQSANGSVWLFDYQRSSAPGRPNTLSIHPSMAGPFIPWGSCTPAPAADCAFTTLTGLSLAGTDLGGINLAGARIVDSDFSGAKLAGADLQYADIKAALTGADLSGVNAYKAQIAGDLTGALVFGAVFRNADLDPSFFATSGATSAIITQAAFYVGTSKALHGFDFAKLDLTGVQFNGSSVAPGDMAGANLSGARLSNTGFYGIDLTGASFKPVKPVGYANPVTFLSSVICPDGQPQKAGLYGFDACRIKVPTK